MKLSRYRLGFDVWGLALFLIVMIPNIVWFPVSAPNDILRVESVTKGVDAVASVCQVMMAAALCFVCHKDREKIWVSPLIAAAAASCLLYFSMWVLYYCGVTHPAVILGLCAFPCAAFLCFAVDRKNMAAAIPIMVFTVCHLTYGVVNFIMKESVIV